MRQQIDLDPAVAAVLGDGRKRERRRQMTRAQRRRAERDAQRQRVNLELDPRVVAMFKRIAESEDCSPAGAVNLLVAAGIRQYVDEELSFYGNRRASEGPRYEWVVQVQGLENLRQELEKFLDGDREL